MPSPEFFEFLRDVTGQALVCVVLVLFFILLYDDMKSHLASKRKKEDARRWLAGEIASLSGSRCEVCQEEFDEVMFEFDSAMCAGSTLPGELIQRSPQEIAAILYRRFCSQKNVFLSAEENRRGSSGE